jgi:diguanylate cyclase (GGDEF)-like protein
MLLVGITFAMGIVNLIVGLVILSNYKNAKGLPQVGILFLLGAEYAIMYGLELTATDLTLKIIFNHLQYFAIPFITVTWLWVAKILQNPGYVLPKKKAFWFLIIPVMTLLGVQFYPFLKWYYTDAYLAPETLEGNFGLAVLVLEKGPLYYVGVSYSVFLLVIICSIYFLNAKQKKGVHAIESFWLGMLSVVCIFTVIPVFLAKGTSGIDWTLYFITAVGFLLLYTMIRYESISLKPSAHRATFEMLGDPVLILDDHQEIMSWNEAFDQISSRPLQPHTALGDYFEDAEMVNAILEERPVEISRKNKKFVVETIPIRLRSGKKSGAIVRFNDMTQYLQRIETLDFEATHDELTRIYNRRAFWEHAEEYLRKAPKNQPFGLLMIDIDDFKTVNDTYGHPIGDCVLEGLATLIQKHLTEGTVFARYGGEEFVVFLENVNESMVGSTAETLRRLVELHPFQVQDLQLNILISIGVATGTTGSPLLLKDYIELADEAMYQSKREGKNRVSFRK